MTPSRNSQEPILPSWKISQVLERYPQLLDVLIGLSPAFGRLRNPILRKIQSRLVTVEQAARIAGLHPAGLVQQLNAAIGFGAPSATEDEAPSSPAESAAPPWASVAPVAVEIDVRPFMARGEEPFSAIMAEASRVPVGQIIRLRNSFEPVPLYGVLGQRGFTSWARQLGPDDWEILFFRRSSGKTEAFEADAASPQQQEAGPPERFRATVPADAWENPSETLTIDVSELVPPEPMVRILEKLEEMRPGQTLRVQHQRRPVHLYPRLEELGYVHETREMEPGQVVILIHKPATCEAGAPGHEDD